MKADIDVTDIGDRTAFIASLYLGMLERQSSPTELHAWEQLMKGGSSAAEIVHAFTKAPEFLSRIARDQRIGADGQWPDPSALVTNYESPGEAGKSYRTRLQSGFLGRYCAGDCVLDVGFSGYNNPDNKPALPHAIGIDLDYPGYDGTHLPFKDGSVDTVFSSHCLEHISDDSGTIRDWFRVLKTGGFIVCIVPHQALYEKRMFMPSRWNADHKRMYTPASLIASFEQALEINSYRVRHLADNDEGFNYELGPELHSDGAYEIELVIQKIEPPLWTLEAADDQVMEAPVGLWRQLVSSLTRD